MEIANRDMFPSDATRARFDRIEPLLDNPVLDSAFIHHDALALSGKSVYHRVGRFAILLIAISAVYTIADALVLDAGDWTRILTLGAAVLAIVGIGLQAFIIVTRQKEKWLLNRFASERIRSLKFQSFHLGDNAADRDSLAEQVASFSSAQLSRLENDLNTGMAVMERFNPDTALKTPPHARLDNADPAIASQSLEAYEELRIRYQSNFAIGEVAHLRGRLRAVTSLQDVMYFSAAAFAFLSLAVKLVDTAHIIPTDWVDFLAVTLFVSGATKAITDNALLEEQSQGRYETYLRNLDHASASASGSGADLDTLVDAIERVALNELDLFCQDALRVSYRF
ncbi:hypothetical protein ACFFUB_10330 [Algimonas porphyrae]|uniref:DUF4231 domain-containing protein n=1 Tax=Algimonas porphyrae TaxID=1128113 RepID=A0ABQ5V341_9PROT|nr:hypothetical protein [Algimonas porphyrae]GLQ21490.1 hypothetical protein GCM10007854_24450 [Algimonas porphyrae]